MEDVWSQDVADAMVLAADYARWGILKCFIEHSGCLNGQASSYAMNVAAANGQLDVVNCCIEYAAVHVRSEAAADAFEVAARYEHWDIVRNLINHGIDVTSHTAAKTFKHAARHGQCEIVKSFLDRADLPHYLPKAVAGAMLLAAKYEHWDVVRCLIEGFKWINDQDVWDTPEALREAARQGQLGVVKCFIQHGVDVESWVAASALWEAAAHGQGEIVEWFFEHDVDVNSEGAKNALYRAARCGQGDVVKCFFKYGVDAKSEAAKDALMVAAGSGQAEIVKCFIEHGVDVKSQAVANALKLAADNELWGVVKCFIDHGVDVKLEAAIDALIVAASHGRDDIVRCFIEHGVDAKSEATANALEALAIISSWGCLQKASGEDSSEKIRSRNCCKPLPKECPAEAVLRKRSRQDFDA